MTNSLIPYSFIPGTKAKAQEINENFIALANQITENKDYTDTKIDDVRSSITNDRAGTKLENTDLISNCILEAPNGIVTYTGNTITVKKGLKVLIPDGRKTDGSLKSIEYTVEEDVLLTTTTNDNINAVYIAENSTGTAEMFQSCINTPPYSSGIWYNPEENTTYMYDSDSSTWEEFPCCIVASYKNSGENVENVKPVYPIGLLKENDIYSILTFGQPDYKNSVSKAASSTEHVAQVNGYLLGVVETQQNQNKYIYIEGFAMKISYHPNGHIGWASLFVPVTKGETYYITGSTNTTLYFIPSKGGF